MAEKDEELARGIGYALSRSPYKVRGQAIETCRIISQSIVQHLQLANWQFKLGKPTETHGPAGMLKKDLEK